MVVVVIGVSGAGKTVVGSTLAQELGWPFFDADDFHPRDNIRKMRSGIPLSESDRIPWLDEIVRLIDALDRSFRSAVIACSALRRSYRETMARKRGTVRFVYLKGEYDLVQQRVRERKGHFMDTRLLDSQFDVLEEPADAVTVCIDQPVSSMVSKIRRELGL